MPGPHGLGQEVPCTSRAPTRFSKSVPLFAHLSKRALRDVTRLATTIDVEAGRVFIEEGDSGT